MISILHIENHGVSWSTNNINYIVPDNYHKQVKMVLIWLAPGELLHK